MSLAELFRQSAFLVDSEGRILATNRPARDQFGQPEHLEELFDAPSDTLTEFLRRCARTKSRCVGAFTAQTGGRFELDGCLVRPRDADSLAVIAVRLLSESESGAVFRLLNHNLKALRDQIAARSRIQAQLQREREWLRVTLMSIGDAVIATDLRGRIELMNPIAQSLTGWSEDEAMGRPLATVFTIVAEDGRTPVESPVDHVLKSGQSATLMQRTLLVSRDGTQWPIDDTAAAIRDDDGAIIGAALVFREVSERRRLELLAESRMQELAESSRRKDEFLAMLAHELRNPLAPILTSAAILKTQPSSRAGVEWMAELIERQATHMVRLVDDLLDISRVTRGKIELRKTKLELARILRNAFESHRTELDQHELEWNVPERIAVVEADPTRIEQVFANVFQNAAKYTPPQGKISVTAEVDSDEAVVRVRDSGIGIASDMLERIFDLFTQGDRGLDRAQGGLGIGLTLVKQLVELHGGTVVAHSAGANQGSEFVVRLPCIADAEARSIEPTAEAGGTLRASGRRVLVVDDNEDAAASLDLLLRSMGHTTFVAHDGRSAIEVAEAQRPDVILLDIGLPGMDGYETAKRLKSSPRTRDAACIALTGYGQDEHRRRSLELGFKAHLTKPVEPATLTKFLAECPQLSNSRG